MDKPWFIIQHGCPLNKHWVKDVRYTTCTRAVHHSYHWIPTSKVNGTHHEDDGRQCSSQFYAAAATTLKIYRLKWSPTTLTHFAYCYTMKVTIPFSPFMPTGAKKKNKKKKVYVASKYNVAFWIRGFWFSPWCYLTGESLWWRGGSVETDFCSLCTMKRDKNNKKTRMRNDRNECWIGFRGQSRLVPTRAKRVGDGGGKKHAQTHQKQQTRYITMENTDCSDGKKTKKSSFVVLFGEDAT